MALIIGDHVRGNWGSQPRPAGLQVPRNQRGYFGIAMGPNSDYDSAWLVTNGGTFRIVAGAGAYPFCFTEGRVIPGRHMGQEPIPQCDYLEVCVAERCEDLAALSGRRAPTPLRLQAITVPAGITSWAGLPADIAPNEGWPPDGLVSVVGISSQVVRTVARLPYFGRVEASIVMLNLDAADSVLWTVRGCRGIADANGDSVLQDTIATGTLAAQTADSVHIFEQHWDFIDVDLSMTLAATTANVSIIGFAYGDPIGAA